MGADDYRRTIYSMFEEEGAGFEKLPEKVTYSVGGQPVEFSQYAEDAGLKIRNQVGVIVRGDRGFQIVCNGLDWQAGTLQRSISQGLNQIDFLTATEIQKLTEEMLAQPDPENAVGPDWGLRDGVYRDFALGMIWRKPKGFWKLSVGDAAQLQNPDTCIIAEELRYGLVMEVIEKSADERDLETFHRDITEYIFDGPVESVETEIGGQPALSSSGLPLVGEQDYEFCVVTSLHNDRAFQFIVWGAPKHMKEYGQEVENALAGFEFPSREMRATRQTATSYEDNRLGFGLKLSDSSWRIQGNKNAEISPIGNSVEFARHDRNVQVSAFASLEPGQDNITLKLHQQIITANFNRFTKMKPNEIVTSFGGLTWKQKSWTADLDSIYYLSALKNHTFFALFILDESGKGEWLLKEVKAGFQLLDDAKP